MTEHLWWKDKPQPDRPSVAARGRGRPTGRTAKTADFMDAAIDILRTVQPTTVRGVCYQLFTRGLIPNMSTNATNRVSRLLKEAREDGTIPWEWIAEDGRPIEGWGGWGDPNAFVNHMLAGYRRDRWQDQPERLIIVSEKGTVGGIIRPITRRYGVQFAVYKGFASATALHDLAERSTTDRRPLTILYVGDHDPSGRYMSDQDMPKRLKRYGGVATIERIALMPAQIAAPNFPTFAAADKRTDARYAWFLQHHGETCAELDALDAPTLRTLIEDAILSHLDLTIWERSGSTEEAEHASLKDFFAAWPGASLTP